MEAGLHIAKRSIIPLRIDTTTDWIYIRLRCYLLTFTYIFMIIEGELRNSYDFFFIWIIIYLLKSSTNTFTTMADAKPHGRAAMTQVEVSQLAHSSDSRRFIDQRMLERGC